MQVVIKILMSLGMKLLTEKAITELILFILKKASESTKTAVDDELYEIVEKAIKK